MAEQSLPRQDKLSLVEQLQNMHLGAPPAISNGATNIPTQEPGLLRCSNLVVGPDQRQVFYTVTGDNGQSQQYAMMDFRDPNLIHQFTQIRQIPEVRGNRAIHIPQPRSGPGAGGDNELGDR